MSKPIAYDYEPEITMNKLLSIQVCVPQDWTNHDVEMFAEKKNPCGTTHGWVVDEPLGRVPCTDRHGFVHVILQA